VYTLLTKLTHSSSLNVRLVSGIHIQGIYVVKV
jgi:hypothetical protein